MNSPFRNDGLLIRINALLFTFLWKSATDAPIPLKKPSAVGQPRNPQITSGEFLQISPRPSGNHQLKICRSAPTIALMTRAPQRIVCLSAESADWLWRIGAWDSVVGITTCFTPAADVPPKPRVSSFSTARFDEIALLRPDLVITFSDVQAPLAAELIRRGLTVFATNQRTLAEIEATLALLGRIVRREREAEERL